MQTKLNQQVLQLNHARRALNKAESMVDIADKYNSNIQGAMEVLAKHLPTTLRKPIFKKARLKNIAGKWITINRYNHWRFINPDRAAKILREVSHYLNWRSKILSDQM